MAKKHIDAITTTFYLDQFECELIAAIARQTKGNRFRQHPPESCPKVIKWHARIQEIADTIENVAALIN